MYLIYVARADVVFRYENWTQKSLKEALSNIGVTTKAKTPKRTLVRLMRESEEAKSPSPLKPIALNEQVVESPPMVSPPKVVTEENKENIEKVHSVVIYYSYL
jgi:hypothetical protein